MEEKDTISPDVVEQELAKIKQQYVYLQADFDNYRKRMDVQRSAWIESAQLEVLTPLLNIIDDIERAEGDIHNPAFELIVKAFKKLIQRFQVVEIDQLTTFDPSLHEAITQVPSTDQAQSGMIAQVFQKGYRIGTTIVRPAKVAVYE